MLILLNRLKLCLDQVFIHIQLLLGEDQVVMEIMTRMASWLCGIIIFIISCPRWCLSLCIFIHAQRVEHIKTCRYIVNTKQLQLGFYPLEIYRSIGDKLWLRFMSQCLAASVRCRTAETRSDLAANLRCRTAVSALTRWTCDYLLSWRSIDLHRNGVLFILSRGGYIH